MLSCVTPLVKDIIMQALFLWPNTKVYILVCFASDPCLEFAEWGVS